MKNKIIGFAVAALFTGLLYVPMVQAETSSQSLPSSFLTSIGQLTGSLTELLSLITKAPQEQATSKATSLQASAIGAFSDQSKIKEIVQKIQSQTNALEALKVAVEQSKTGVDFGSSVSQAAQAVRPAVQQIERTLSVGSTGEDVKIVQQYLVSQDLFSEKSVTGYYGALTSAAVKDFQNKIGLEPVGIVGPKTKEAMNKAIAESEHEDDSNITIPPTLTLHEYTVALLNITNELKRAPIGSRSSVARRLAEYAKMRKGVVLETIKTDPETVFRNVFPNSVLSGVSGDILNLVEQRKQIRGKFEYIHIHLGDFETGTTEDQFYVTDSTTNKRYRVYLKGIPQALTDDIVTIDGAVLDDQIATVDASIKVVSNSAAVTTEGKKLSFSDKVINLFRPKTADAQTAIVQKKTAVIMFNWQNDLRTTFTEASARGTFFTNATSSNSYFKENSFGKVELVGKLRSDGDVFNWVTIPYDNVNCSTMWQTWATAAEKVLQAQGIDLTGYGIKTYVFPLVSCGWNGLGYLGGNPARSYINGTSLGVITHELGHNFGAHHASSWSCVENGVRVSVSADANCLLGEYRDPYSVMGNAVGMKHMNNFHKGTTLTVPNYSLNWLDPANTKTIDLNVSPDGTYTITPIEQASGGVQSLRIPRLISSTGVVLDYYYLEFRQPFGFDSSIDASATNGVTIRIAPNYNSISKSKLIDTTPGTTSFLDAPLAVSKTFSDMERAIHVTTLGTSPTGASVRVSFGTLPCTRSNPAFSISPSSVSVFVGQSASFNYTLTNNDTTTCPLSNFSITPTLPDGFAQTPSPIAHSLAGGASVSGSLIISTAFDASMTSYSVIETAQNMSSTAYKSTASLVMTVVPSDTTPPVVTITKPLNGTIVSRGSMKIAASASDASGIAQIRVLLDGIVLNTCYGTTACLASASVSSLSIGTHTITVEATDNGGPVANTSFSSVTITKK